MPSLLLRARCAAALLLLSFCCCRASTRALPAETAARRRNATFDYFLFVRQWDPSICDAMACGPRKPTADAFTIHGLWPERADGSWPQYCGRPDSWSPSDLAPLLPRLRAAWPSFGRGDDPAFWAHEWLRHGTCAGLPGGPRAFFQAVLDLNDALPLGPALARAAIAPTAKTANATAYRVADVAAAVTAVTGSTPAIRCGPPRSRARGELAEVWVCLARGSLDVVDCPPGVTRSGGCPGGRVVVPSVRGGEEGSGPAAAAAAAAA